MSPSFYRKSKFLFSISQPKPKSSFIVILCLRYLKEHSMFTIIVRCLLKCDALKTFGFCYSS